MNIFVKSADRGALSFRSNYDARWSILIEQFAMRPIYIVLAQVHAAALNRNFYCRSYLVRYHADCKKIFY